jgi:hypothetical protein
MIQHGKELILVCWHIGPEVVAKERYKIFLDLGESSHSVFVSSTRTLPGDEKLTRRTYRERHQGNAVCRNQQTTR